MGKLRFSLIAALWAALSAPAFAQIDPNAGRANAEFEQICREDSGRLWGASLCGPLLVVDPASRAIWASDPDGQAQLTRSGDGWTGVLPSGVPVANTSVDWAGVRWAMVTAPLPEDAVERRVLVLHEAWHRVQDSLNLPVNPSANAHLETDRGRTSLRLEMRALATALRSNGSARRNAALDALAFRASRLLSFPGAAGDEAALDRNEGLAAYTGVRLGGGPAPVQIAMRILDQHDRHDALARAYAYATGPAYGLLLDEFEPQWRSNLGAAAPADLLVVAIRFRPYSTREMTEVAERYGGQQVAAEERARADARRTLLAAMRSLYIDGPRLMAPLSQAQLSFDPNQVTPLDGLGSVYATLSLRDVWGELSAQNGAFMASDHSMLTLGAPAPGGLSGPGWRLTPAPGWRAVGPDPGGVWRLEPIPTP